ncbi:MAG TPA: hypothetical protein VFH13_07160, partial [Gemmatimonadaceae bacterium]|nr:hypothetical protein [Gemmatimonadaceae bacterium]
RKSHGPALRQHEEDVLAFLKARLKAGSKRLAESRQNSSAAGLEDEGVESPDQEPEERTELEPTGS